MNKNILLVNEKDEVIGTTARENCHKEKGILHRAFETLIFNDKNQLLIQQRSKYKRLWPLYWSGSCCSHVYQNEDYKKAAERRLREELSFSCELKYLFKFQYQALYKNIGSENEICAVLIGKYNGEIHSDPKEVADWKFTSLSNLEDEVNKNPKKFTPWFQIAVKKFLKAYSKDLSQIKKV